MDVRVADGPGPDSDRNQHAGGAPGARGRNLLDGEELLNRVDTVEFY